MADRIMDSRGRESFVVKYDIDRNGAEDSIKFEDKDVAKEFEDCFVNRSNSACAKFGTGEMFLDGTVRLMTGAGRLGKECSINSNDAPMYDLKRKLLSLASSSLHLEDLLHASVVSDLFSYVTGDLKGEALKNVAAKYLRQQNKEMRGDKMSDEQINLIARLLVSYSEKIGDATDLQVKALGSDIKQSIFDKASRQFHTCISGDSYTYYSCLDEKIDLERQDLGDVFRLFYEPDCSVGLKEISAERKIQDIWCAAGSFVEYHYDNGNLALVTLSRDQTVAEMEFKKGTILSLTDEGNVEYALLGTDQMLNGIMLSKKERVEFFENTNDISYCTLAKEEEIEGITIPENSRLDFSASGKLNNIIAGKNMVIKDINILKGETAQINTDGSIKVVKKDD